MVPRLSRARRLASALLSVVATAACTGGNGSAPTPPAPSTTLPLSAAGISPKTVTIAVGSQVTFVNSDAVAHTVFSGPHPEHTDCPALNQVGFLQPGDTRQSGNLNTADTCGFHDESSPFNTLFQGNIIVR